VASPAVAYAAPIAAQNCPNCNNVFGPGKVCQSCRQVQGFAAGVTLAPVGRRLGAACMEGLLAIVTLGLGYLIWLLIAWGKGQSPGKQVLKMRVVKLDEGRRAGWGTMFLRDSICKGIFNVITGATGLGAILYFWLCWDNLNQELWDKMVGTVVVNDPNGLA
jgi:uncharacterized RDD family membrane protein YckC